MKANYICLAGENLNVMSKRLGAAMKSREADPIIRMAEEETAAGMDYIDVNLGPARKGGRELMEWMVKTIQGATDLPLFLDTSNVEAIEAGLRVYEPKRGKAVINSVMARQERIDALVPLAAKYDAGIVALLWGPEGMPRDTDERAMHAYQLYMAATESGIPPGDIWIDPIITPVNVQQEQLIHCMEFYKIQEELAPGCRSTNGLSNVSNGVPDHLRPILNQTLLMMLMHCGVQGTILDAFDKDLQDIARGRKKELVDLIGKVMAADAIDISTLTKDEVDYVKTARVLLGKSLYSDSWLEL
jgi:5-methyltetrahydrofolate corrinoid/iron sulfur protein methyltransferase